MDQWANLNETEKIHKMDWQGMIKRINILNLFLRKNFEITYLEVKDDLTFNFNQLAFSFHRYYIKYKRK